MIIGILKEKKGASTPLAIAVVILFFLIMTACFEWFRLNTIVGGVRDALDRSVIVASTDNYYTVYNGVIEGYSCSGDFEGPNENFVPQINPESVLVNLEEMLGLQKNGSELVKGKEYKIYDLKVNTYNTPVGTSNPSITEQFTIESKITLEVPLDYGWGKLPPFKVNLFTRAGYSPKF